MSKPTPGPWIIGSEPTLKAVRIRSSDLNDPPIAHVYWSDVPPARPEHGREQAAANARLIAAVTDLLAVVEQVAWTYEAEQRDGRTLPGQTYGTIPHELGQAARAALAKAEGGAA